MNIRIFQGLSITVVVLGVVGIVFCLVLTLARIPSAQGCNLDPVDGRHERGDAAQQDLDFLVSILLGMPSGFVSLLAIIGGSLGAQGVCMKSLTCIKIAAVSMGLCMALAPAVSALSFAAYGWLDSECERHQCTSSDLDCVCAFDHPSECEDWCKDHYDYFCDDLSGKAIANAMFFLFLWIFSMISGVCACGASSCCKESFGLEESAQPQSVEVIGRPASQPAARSGQSITNPSSTNRSGIGATASQRPPSIASSASCGMDIRIFRCLSITVLLLGSAGGILSILCIGRVPEAHGCNLDPMLMQGDDHQQTFNIYVVVSLVVPSAFVSIMTIVGGSFAACGVFNKGPNSISIAAIFLVICTITAPCAWGVSLGAYDWIDKECDGRQCNPGNLNCTCVHTWGHHHNCTDWCEDHYDYFCDELSGKAIANGIVFFIIWVVALITGLRALAALPCVRECFGIQGKFLAPQTNSNSQLVVVGRPASQSSASLNPPKSSK